MDSAALWQGSFGNAYTDRNRVDWAARVPFWNRLLQKTNPRSVLEVGCNAGWNLRAIRGLDHRIDLRGIDVNKQALTEAQAAGLDVIKAGADELAILWRQEFDLVFTAGVLIHIPPDGIDLAMASIAQASRRWVLAIEYGADQEEGIPYHGHNDALWKRPFGQLYQELGLRIVEQGAVLRPAGFDNCHYWLCEK